MLALAVVASLALCASAVFAVDPFNGQYSFSESDLGYPLPSMARVTRSYSSGIPTVGPFGKGTSSNFDRRLVVGAGDTLIYMTSDGGSYGFINGGGGTYTNSSYPFLRHARAYLVPERKLEFAGGVTYIFNGTDGSLERTEDPEGNWVEITRSPATGDITDVDDSYGRGLSVTSTSGIVNSIAMKSDPTKSVQYEYNADSTLASVTYPDGASVSYVYSTGRLASVTNPMGVAELTNIYNGAGRVVSQDLANGGTFNFDYITGEGTIEETHVTRPGGGTIKYKFNSLGYITETVDPYDNSTLYERDPSTSALVNATDPLGRQTSYTYDSSGYPETVTDPAENTTSFIYNATIGRPEQVTDALSHTTTLKYDSNGNLTEIQPPSPYGATAMTYNSFGLLDTITNALGNTTSFEYYPAGQIANVVDPLGNTVAHYEYDSIGRLANATSPWPGSRTTSYAYDAVGRVQTVTDALSHTTGFANDLDGNLTGVTDARTNTIGFTYNQRGLINSMTDQLDNSETYGYDLNDNLTSVTDRKGQSFGYTYDLMDRMTRADYPGTGNYTAYGYDTASRITDIEAYENSSLVSSIGYAWTNSANGDKHEDRVKTVTTTYGGIANTITYGYDELGRRTSMAVQGQPTVYYTYDSGGVMNSVSMTHPVHGEQTFAFDHDAAGRRTGLAYPNGVEAAYTYYPTGAVEAITITNSSGAIESLGYSYDEAYNRTGMSRQGVAVKLPPAVADAQYDSANRLTSFGGQAVLHDENGNITSWGNKSYLWDSRDRLVEVRESGNTIATFKYDALGRRAEKTAGGVTTRYLYDGLDVVMETDASGTPTVFYIRTLNIDEPLARIEINTGDIRYYHADALGSIIALTDETGTVKTRYNYSPFGDVEIMGEASENPFQYTGRENDGATGIYYYRARYYSPEMGRFISEDPIGLAGGDVNLFAYVKNQPCNLVDPLGLWKISVGGSMMFFDISTTVYDSDYGWFPNSKPDIGVSTTLIGGGFKFSWGEPDERCELYHPNSDESYVAIGVPSKYLSYEQGLDMSQKSFNVGLGLGSPISYSTSINNFGEWLRKKTQKYSRYINK